MKYTLTWSDDGWSVMLDGKLVAVFPTFDLAKDELDRLNASN